MTTVKPTAAEKAVIKKHLTLQYQNIGTLRANLEAIHRALRPYGIELVDSETRINLNALHVRVLDCTSQLHTVPTESRPVAKTGEVES